MCYSLLSHHILTKLNTNRSVWSDVKYLLKNDIHPSVQFHGLVKCVLIAKATLKLFWWLVVVHKLTNTLYIGVSFNSSPVNMLRL